MKRLITILLILIVLIFSPFLFVIYKMFHCFEGSCFLSGHAWVKGNKLYMLPVRRCAKCWRVQVKIPELNGVSKGGWVNHNLPLNKGNVSDD